MRGPSARARRGLTLIEVMIGTLVAIVITAAAVAFATQETRLMDVSQERLQMSMVGRSSLALLADDLRRAGAGIGYNEQRQFMGLVTGDFTAGGLAWSNAVTHTFTRPGPGPTSGQDYDVITADLGIRYASGSYATIARERGNVGVVCVGPGIQFRSGELVVMRDGIGLSAVSGTVEMSGLAAGADCPCLNGCQQFLFTPSTDFTTGIGATTVSYGWGELQGGLRTVVWYVNQAGGQGELRRAELTGQVCTDRATCGGVVADFADSLLYQVWRWSTAAGGWVQQPLGAIDPPAERLRVDVELILRSDSESPTLRPVVTSRLAAARCVPGCAPADRDGYVRSAYRTSVEVMNSGAMLMAD